MTPLDRRGFVAATAVGLAGCSSSEDSTDALVDGEAHSREHWQFDLAADDRIAITVDIVERPSFGDEFSIDVETVSEGVVASWEPRVAEDVVTVEFTAERDAEHTLKVYHVGIAEVTVEKWTIREDSANARDHTGDRSATGPLASVRSGVRWGTPPTSPRSDLAIRHPLAG